MSKIKSKSRYNNLRIKEEELYKLLNKVKCVTILELVQHKEFLDGSQEMLIKVKFKNKIDRLKK